MSKKEKQIKKRLRTKKVKQLSQGIFSTLFDITLFSLYLPLCSFGKKPNSRDVYKTFDEAYEMLEEINYKKFKHSFDTLRKNGFIESIKDWTNKPIITAIGRKRMKNFLPEYEAKRFWDGKIYLISYDFEVKQNRIRDLFRKFIKKLGAFQIQKSLYITFNNPYELIKEFKKEYDLKETILISELGKKGFLGKKSLKNFLWKASGLEKINLNYSKFIEKYKNYRKSQSNTSLLKVSLEYYSILKNDPQLPFELLKDDYLGDRAYLLFKTLTKNKIG